MWVSRAWSARGRLPGRRRRAGASPRRRRWRIAGPTAEACGRRPDGHVLLVHRRLAIIDPGPDGVQPMSTPDGRHRIVFNGEIYNYRRPASRGPSAAVASASCTNSDTEVLLHLAATERPGALSRVCAGCSPLRAGTSRPARSSWPAIGSHQAAVCRGGRRAASHSRRRLAALRSAGAVDGQPSAAGILAFPSGAASCRR